MDTLEASSYLKNIIIIMTLYTYYSYMHAECMIIGTSGDLIGSTMCILYISIWVK